MTVSSETFGSSWSHRCHSRAFVPAKTFGMCLKILPHGVLRHTSHDFSETVKIVGTRLATGSISFATLYLGQKYFTRQIKGMKTSNIIISSSIFSLITSYLIVSAKLDECNKNFRKANTGRYGETWSDKIAKPENWSDPRWKALPVYLLVCRLPPRLL